MDFSTLFIVGVLNALMTCWTFGKGELQTANGLFSITGYIFHSCNLISHHPLPQFRWFLTVHALRFKSSMSTTCHHDKTKNPNSSNMIIKGNNKWNLWKGCYYHDPFGRFESVHVRSVCVITSSVWMEFATVRVCLRAASRCKVSNFRVSKYSENFLKVVLSVHTIVSLALGVYLFWMKHFFTVVVLCSYIVYFVTESYFHSFLGSFLFLFLTDFDECCGKKKKTLTQNLLRISFKVAAC